MEQNYYWSKTTNSFYPASMLDAYKTAGTFPTDAALIDDTIFETYAGKAPDGETRGSDETGNPAWVAIKPIEVPFVTQAERALSDARTYVQNNFIYLGETPTQDWIDYQKALIAITNGTDTKSKVLPSAPTA